MLNQNIATDDTFFLLSKNYAFCQVTYLVHFVFSLFLFGRHG